MLKNTKVSWKPVKKLSEIEFSYEEDFEDFDFGDDIDNIVSRKKKIRKAKIYFF